MPLACAIGNLTSVVIGIAAAIASFFLTAVHWNLPERFEGFTTNSYWWTGVALATGSLVVGVNLRKLSQGLIGCKPTTLVNSYACITGNLLSVIAGVAAAIASLYLTAFKWNLPERFEGFTANSYWWTGGALAIGSLVIGVYSRKFARGLIGCKLATEAHRG